MNLKFTSSCEEPRARTVRISVLDLPNQSGVLLCNPFLEDNPNGIFHAMSINVQSIRPFDPYRT